jgi:alkylated DNA repair dioxygenase AlkB
VYPVKPKQLPPILDQLRNELEKKTSSRFNAIIVNFYQDGNDSISYHADDETFLGPLPTIASLSLGSSRDFFLRRKLENDKTSTQQFYTKGSGPAASRLTEKMKLDDGDLLVMKGRSQAEWEHAIPKRANAGGRINLTFRKVVSVKGTNNFQRYNRGLPTDDETRTYRWDIRRQKMMPGIGGI